MKKYLAVAVILLFISVSVIPSTGRLIFEDKSTEFVFIEIKNIEGGFGIHAVIHNRYHSDLYDMGWRISLSKGGLILIGKERTGLIKILSAGERAKIWSFVFGIFGRGMNSYIKISAILEGSVVEERIAMGEIIGPFVRDIVVDPHMV